MPFLQIISDLHLENHSRYGQFKITPTAPYLALLGDIGCVQQDAKKGIFRTMLLRLLTQYKAIFYVAGNHEPYLTTWPAVHEWLEMVAETARAKREAGEEIGAFVPLNMGRVDLEGDVTVLGCTLFSKVEESKMGVVGRKVNDFRKIKWGWSVKEHNWFHGLHVEWLNGEVERAEREGRKVVVLTHHSPTVDERAVEEVYRGDELFSNFSTDLSGEYCWRSNAVKLWAFGHTHYNCDYVDEFGKRVYANQKGYVMTGDSNGYGPERAVSI